MCGLFGWATDNSVKTKQRKSAFRTLAWFNDFRGGDSYGIYAVDRGLIYRGVGDLYPVRWPEEDRPSKSTQLIAHTRYATHGAVKPDNSHPFVVGNITGVHNGIIHNHGQLNADFKRSFEVDSQHIFAHINDGLDLKDLEGYGTIVYTDARQPGKIFLGTFGGDLAIARLAREKGIVWSSDERHLKDALKDMGLPFALLKVENRHLYCIEDNEIYETDQVIDIREQRSLLTWSGQWREETDTFDDDDFEPRTTCCKDKASGCFPEVCYCECVGCFSFDDEEEETGSEAATTEARAAVEEDTLDLYEQWRRDRGLD